jgi:hypothetical protein
MAMARDKVQVTQTKSAFISCGEGIGRGDMLVFRGSRSGFIGFIRFLRQVRLAVIACQATLAYP